MGIDVELWRAMIGSWHARQTRLRSLKDGPIHLEPFYIKIASYFSGESDTPAFSLPTIMKHVVTNLDAILLRHSAI